MKTRVQKWGKGLGLRIPKAVAARAGLRADSPVELAVIEGQLVVRPIAEGPQTLDELLSKVTDENLHGEWETGPATGREAW